PLFSPRSTLLDSRSSDTATIRCPETPGGGFTTTSSPVFALTTFTSSRTFSFSAACCTPFLRAAEDAVPATQPSITICGGYRLSLLNTRAYSCWRAVNSGEEKGSAQPRSFQ